ncbi:MAG: class I SAM-dependent methyltransferase [Ktedonobacteraceae bacterium]
MTEAERPFVGWDFSHITDTRRMVEAPLTWSYSSNVLRQFSKIHSLLDMDTGGGEFLALLQPLPSYTCATENYGPNVSVARRRLEPLGVQVFEVSEDNSNLPFVDNEFELIINRHGSYIPGELLRILKAGGQFITQQVGGQSYPGLNALFGIDEEHQYAHWNLPYAVKELTESGFEILEQREDFPITRFFDVGAIVYNLKAVPWQIPDFAVEKYFDALLKIHSTIQKQNYVDVYAHRFLIVAQKR